MISRNQVDIKFWSNKTILCFRQRHLEYFVSGRRAEMTCLFTFRWGIFSRNINALCNAFIVWTLCYWRSASAAVVVEHSRRAESQWVALFRPLFYDHPTDLVRNHPPNIVVGIGRFTEKGRRQKSLKMQMMSDLKLNEFRAEKSEKI